MGNLWEAADGVRVAFPAAWRWAIQREKSMRHPCAHPPWEVLSIESSRAPTIEAMCTAPKWLSTASIMCGCTPMLAVRWRTKRHALLPRACLCWRFGSMAPTPRAAGVARTRSESRRLRDCATLLAKIDNRVMEPTAGENISHDFSCRRRRWRSASLVTALRTCLFAAPGGRPRLDAPNSVRNSGFATIRFSPTLSHSCAHGPSSKFIPGPGCVFGSQSLVYTLSRLARATRHSANVDPEWSRFPFVRKKLDIDVRTPGFEGTDRA